MKLHCWKLMLCAGMVVMAQAGCSKKEEPSRSKATADSVRPAAAHGPATEAGQPTGAGLKFTAPVGWISETPTLSMRRAQYRLPRVEGDSEDAEMVVYYFQGGGGGVQANVDRWIGQFSKPDGSPANDVAKISRKTIHGIPVTTVDVAGTYSGAMGPMGGSSEAKTNYRMLAAVAEADNGPWFFKLTGPAKTVAKWEPSFESFIDSIQQ
jgi:hypothetical protein